MKTREEKDQDIVALKGEFSRVSHALMISFQGLTVEKDWELRKALREAQLEYRVVKNTLGRRAVEGTALEPLRDHFVGMTGVAYSESDPVSLAKVLTNFAKENTKVVFKGGVVEGRAIKVSEIEALSKLPSKDELISQLMFLLNAPAQRMAVALNGVARNLAVVVGEIAKQKQA
ncbi:MAG: 50S ribosomal protein L10 [Acidobacteria bacterium]|nr:50S ribosomal protein L10 [Acidobacteriota bacterium]